MLRNLPVDGATIDQGRKHATARSERVSHGWHTQHNMKILSYSKRRYEIKYLVVITHNMILQLVNLDMKCWKMPSLSSSAIPADFAMGRTTESIASNSSRSYKFGTSPEFKILLMSSRNSSWTIWNKQQNQQQLKEANPTLATITTQHCATNLCVCE